MSRSAVVKDLLVVLGAFVVAGVLVGLVWPQLVDPVVLRRNDFGVVTDEVALSERFDSEGWYSLLAAGSGLLLGIGLTWLRRAHEVVTVLAVVAGACIAAWLSTQVGLAVGPEDPSQRLADAEIGSTAPAQLMLDAAAVYLVWPIAALVGSVVVLWGRPGDRSRDREDTPVVQ